MPETDEGVGKRSLKTIKRLLRQPRLVLSVSLTSVPLNFAFYYLLAGTPAFLYFPLLLIGYSLTFCLLYYGWFRAAAFFKEGVEEEATGCLFRNVRLVTRTGLATGLIHVLGFMVAQTLTGFIVSYMAAGAGEGSAVVLSIVYFYLAYLVADLALVLLAVTPQVVMYGEASHVEAVLRESYQWIKERYRPSLALYILPDLVARSAYLGVSLLLYYLPRWEGFLVILLLFMALLEGVKTSFIASAFQSYYEEERKSRKKAKPSKSAREQRK